MILAADALANVTSAFLPRSYQRLFPIAHMNTPLGTGLGAARFSSVSGNFHTLYAAASLATAIAETIIRDRFEGVAARHLFSSELAGSGVASLKATTPLALVDLRTDGCFQLGVSTDIAGAKGEGHGWAASREIAQYVYDQTVLDGFLYRSRITGAHCIAVFDRAIAGKLTAGPGRPLLSVPSLSTALKNLHVEVIR